MGRCGRLFLRSLAIGVDEIVNIAQRSDAICGWHLNGYNRKCSAAVRKYLAVAALTGRPSESLLINLMKDDRFLKHCDNNWEGLTDEHKLILDMPGLFFYNTIAELISLDPLLYKSQVVQASLTLMGYLYMDFWLPTLNSPFKYVVGDTHQNIAELKSAARQPKIPSYKKNRSIRVGVSH